MKDITILNSLKNDGFRITKVRKAMLSILSNAKKPLSIIEVTKELLNHDLSANKTTLYREMNFLSKLGIIKEIEFGDGKKRYELVSDSHHHHIVCVECGAVVDIDFDVDLAKHEKEISTQSGFEIKEHSIEFFGICKKCQS